MKLRDFFLIAGGVLLAATILAKGRPTPTVPHIVTQYDTVKVIDTLWLTKLKHDTVYKDNIVERVTVSKPETIFVFHPLDGILAVSVPNKVGDSTLVLGYSYRSMDTAFVKQEWQYQYWTPGPLRSVTLSPSGAPSVDFYKPPQICTGKDKLRYAGEGALGITLLRTLLGH